jgi:ketosteroid isomerase-like protein
MPMDDVATIRSILQVWAENTRLGKQDAILANHAPDVLIFDVLKPMQYESAAAYRASWGEWQPQTVGDNVFELQNLKITAGRDVAFAHAFLRCGGTSRSGKTFEDLVRATFCLAKPNGIWQITHQHISKPLGVDR